MTSQPARESDRRVLVVGLVGPPPADLARRVGDAAIIVGSARQVDLLRSALGPGALEGTEVVLVGSGGEPLGSALATLGELSRPAAVLASGDPGFFGVLAALRKYVDAERIEVHPAPSAVAVAFARLCRPWQDATVVSAHGRPLHAAALAAARSPLAAVLCSPEAPPERVAAELDRLGQGEREGAVAERLGEPGERLTCDRLGALADGRFDPLAVLVALDDDARPPRSAVHGARHAPLAWGLPDPTFDRDGGLLTKAEVRSVVLARLALPAEGVVWDVGAGSGSVAVECALLQPGLEVLAVERDAKRLGLVRRNAEHHGTVLDTVLGEAPEVLADLPSPDRVFVGGGGLAVLDACLERLSPGGIAVATYASLERAAGALDRLGNLVQLGVSRARRLPDGSTRLAAENPVFVAWGPSEEPRATPGRQ
jgi:precorrin-6Y C5,15-methyltransferase (decarboxylating)